MENDNVIDIIKRKTVRGFRFIKFIVLLLIACNPSVKGAKGTVATS